MTKRKTKSALSYFGSDSEVASHLAAMLDDCNHVTIPFCGGLSILPHLNARAVVANDVHKDAINFYRVLSEGGERTHRLIERCKKTLSHPDELDLSRAYLVSRDEQWEVQRAWAFWALCWIGRKGKGGTKHQGGMPSVRRTASGGTNASRIQAAANDLGSWAADFSRCEWESIDFRDLIPRIADKAQCGVYCDPPWVDVGRNYRHAFGASDHRDLAALLSRFEDAVVVVRYGDHPLIRNLYDGWDITEASSRTQTNSATGELWITNKRGDDA